MTSVHHHRYQQALEGSFLRQVPSPLHVTSLASVGRLGRINGADAPEAQRPPHRGPRGPRSRSGLVHLLEHGVNTYFLFFASTGIRSPPLSLKILVSIHTIHFVTTDGFILVFIYFPTRPITNALAHHAIGRNSMFLLKPIRNGPARHTVQRQQFCTYGAAKLTANQ